MKDKRRSGAKQAKRHINQTAHCLGKLLAQHYRARLEDLVQTPIFSGDDLLALLAQHYPATLGDLLSVSFSHDDDLSALLPAVDVLNDAANFSKDTP